MNIEELEPPQEVKFIPLQLPDQSVYNFDLSRKNLHTKDLDEWRNSVREMRNNINLETQTEFTANSQECYDILQSITQRFHSAPSPVPGLACDSGIF